MRGGDKEEKYESVIPGFKSSGMVVPKATSSKGKLPSNTDYEAVGSKTVRVNYIQLHFSNPLKKQTEMRLVHLPLQPKMKI